MGHQPCSIRAVKSSLRHIPDVNGVRWQHKGKSQVQENKFHTFCYPSLAAKGIQWVVDYVSESRQLDTTIVPLIPSSYIALYVRLLVQYIDVVHGLESKPRWDDLPTMRKLKSSAILKVCHRPMNFKERRPACIWNTLHAQQVPFGPKEFEVVALWRKL